MTRDERLMGLARFVASWSKDPTTKVGAVIVGTDPRMIALGYNGFPAGIQDTEERLNDRSTKHRLTQHAERNALDNSRFDVSGGTLYATKFPCSECTKSVISRGLRRVVCPPPTNDEPWRSDSEWSILMLQEVGIDLVLVEDPRKEPEMGKSWSSDIAEMHEKFGEGGLLKRVEEMPEDLRKEFWEFRLRFLEEELNELLWAETPEDAVDALIDLCVVAVGTLDAFGVRIGEAWDLVHKANMVKTAGANPNRPNKFGLPDLVKPEGWKAPDHSRNVGIVPVPKAQG